MMRNLWIPLAAIALFALAIGPAKAQLDGIRCAGWPGARGVPGLIVARPGATCTGALYGAAQKNALVGFRVASPPHVGRFTVTGLRTFSYTAPPDFSGQHAVVVESDWQDGSRIYHRRHKLRIVSEAEYYSAGGTQGAPAASMMTSRGKGRHR